MENGTLDEEFLNDEHKIRLNDVSITSKTESNMYKGSAITQPLPNIALSPNESFRSVNKSKRSNVIMENLDFLNDKQHSESFDHPKSTNSKHIEELDQAKVYL